ncbi:hypothetical protein [Mycobacteroides abscessus]|uniref:hypothetical protein n=1 Tax=Mycobacteroides abscessus TaxID=36809 RepID=UPI00266FBB8D|nr:hypothetical protein [Mycobacteroides abscessus]MDO3110462.1 hypothetical protein [Mycobacteroides abscessus subsp. abscessus]
MDEFDLEVARYRRASEQLAWESAKEQGTSITVRAVVYYGTVAAAMRTHHLTGGGETGRTFTDALMETLIGDPLGVQAATELGPVTCLAMEKWIGSVWQWVVDRATEAPMQPVTAIERAHRRAAVEHALEKVSYPEARSVSAVVACVETIAAARTRWHLGEFDTVEDMDPGDLIRGVEAVEPIAAAADAELDGDEKGLAAKTIVRYWDDMRDRAQDLLSVESMAEAVEGPAQRVEAARRGVQSYLRGLGLEDRDILMYAGVVAAGRAKWLDQGADPELHTLFVEQEPDLDPSAEKVDELTRELVRKAVDTQWEAITGGTVAAD